MGPDYLQRPGGRRQRKPTKAGVTRRCVPHHAANLAVHRRTPSYTTLRAVFPTRRNYRLPARITHAGLFLGSPFALIQHQRKNRPLRPVDLGRRHRQPRRLLDPAGHAPGPHPLQCPQAARGASVGRLLHLLAPRARRHGARLRLSPAGRGRRAGPLPLPGRPRRGRARDRPGPALAARGLRHGRHQLPRRGRFTGQPVGGRLRGRRRAVRAPSAPRLPAGAPARRRPQPRHRRRHPAVGAPALRESAARDALRLHARSREEALSARAAVAAAAPSLQFDRAQQGGRRQDPGAAGRARRRRAARTLAEAHRRLAHAREREDRGELRPPQHHGVGGNLAAADRLRVDFGVAGADGGLSWRALIHSAHTRINSAQSPNT